MCRCVCVDVCVCTHQAQQVEEQVCVFPDQVVRLAAQVHKVVEATGRFVSSVDDIRHVGGEDEGGPVPAQSQYITTQFQKFWDIM